MSDRQQFHEHYRQLTDDELARIALAGDLVPEADEALRFELSRRGLIDLSSYKRSLEEAADLQGAARQMEFQAATGRRFAESMLVLVACVGATTLPLILTLHPRDANALTICLGVSLVIACSCFLGIRARKIGSRTGAFFKLTLPLILLGLSTVVALTHVL
jgi:hypothetical protein